MNHHRLISQLAAVLASGLLVCIDSALAQANYPSQRVTLVVSAAPGGGLDGTARLLAKYMTEAWNQPVIVENQGGADGLIATQRVVKSVPDGYTMLLQIPSLLLFKHNAKELALDARAVLTPVAELGRTPSVVVVQSKLPVRDIKELVVYCNSSPKPCTWGSGQQLSYLYGKRLFAVSGIKDTVNVPYKGTGPVINDLLGGHIAIGVTSIAAPLSHHQSGLLRILAVNAEKRAQQIPGVPTFHEAGLNVPARGSWYGLFVPRKTPPEVIAKIEQVIAAMSAEKTATDGMRSLGAEPVFGTAKEFAAALQEEDLFLDGLVAQYQLK